MPSKTFVSALLAVSAAVLLLTASACSGAAGGAPASPTPSGRARANPAPSGVLPGSIIPVDPNRATSTPAGKPTGAKGKTQLTVNVDDGSGNLSSWTLTCNPAGGTHPNPEQACAALAANASALPPVPPDRACTMQYGGPQRATVTGTWRGEPVQATFSRENGCEIARWDALVGLLPSAGI